MPLPTGDKFAPQYGAAAATAAARSGLDWPAAECLAIAPNDIVPLLQGPCRGIYVGGAGAVKVDDCSDNPVVLTGVTAGSILPIRAKKVYATGTAATNLIALY
jgi:hypothetical protein